MSGLSWQGWEAGNWPPKEDMAGQRRHGRPRGDPRENGDPPGIGDHGDRGERGDSREYREHGDSGDSGHVPAKSKGYAKCGRKQKNIFA